MINTLDVYGLVIAPSTENEVEAIRSKLDPETNTEFKSVWKVTNFATEEKFDAYMEKHNIQETQIGEYHGFQNPDCRDIITQGLKLHPKKNGTDVAVYNYM